MPGTHLGTGSALCDTMCPGLSVSSSPTLPLTVDPAASLPDLSPPDESEALTEVMPHRAWLTHLSSAGERPAAPPQLLEDGACLERNDDVRAFESELEVVCARPTHHAERAYFPPVTLEPPAVEAPRTARRRSPPLRVWLTVVLVGAAIGTAGGLTAATATAPPPTVCPDAPAPAQTEPAPALQPKTTPAEAVPLEAQASTAAPTPRLAKTPPGSKAKGAPKRPLAR